MTGPTPGQQSLAALLPEIGRRTLVMGILNATPDSFSDGGRYDATDAAIARAHALAAEGADLIDIGGESTRPGAIEISAAEEIARVMPIVEALIPVTSVPVSIDTYKAETALRALQAGVHLVNDTGGLQRDPQMANVVAAFRVPVVVMHHRFRVDETVNIVQDISDYFRQSLDIANRAGIARADILLDPGIGFGKTLKQNLEIIARLAEFRKFGCPLLIGASRKSMIGSIVDQPVEDRLFGTLGAHLVALSHGADVLRVHDVRPHVEAVCVADAIRERRTARIALSLGSNMGDCRANLDEAVTRLARGGVRIIARSADFATPPWGMIDQPDYVNSSLIGETELSPRALLDLCLTTEAGMGRQRRAKFGPRLIDIDILTYDDRVLAEPGLDIPHPRMTLRAFVLVPLAEIAPHIVVGGRAVGDWAESVDRTGIVRLD